MTMRSSGEHSAPMVEKLLLLMCRSVRVRRTRTIRAMASTMETIPGCRSLEESPIPHGQITPTALGVTPLGRFESFASTGRRDARALLLLLLLVFGARVYPRKRWTGLDDDARSRLFRL